MNEPSDHADVDIVELPNDAMLDLVAGCVSFPIDRMMVTFTTREFEEFFSSLSEVRDAVKSYLEADPACPTCGTSFGFPPGNAPIEDDYN